ALANVDSVDITIHGRGGHGSRPHQAIDPVVAAAHLVVALQTVVSRRVDPLEPAVITVGSIHAGSKHNIISDRAKMQITVRSYTDDTRKVLLDGIRGVAVNTCRALGCAKEPDILIKEQEYTPATYNDPELADAAAEVFKQLLGPEKVILSKPVMGGEDFGRFPKHLGVPGLIFWLGSVNQGTFDTSCRPGGPPLPSLHSSKYYPDPEPTIRTGVKSMTSLALALLDAKN
ncbi:MAG: M20 metallopeptidase family protein, partial [Planctomycetota bacterium]